MAFRYSEYTGTAGADSWTNICDTVYFGLGGDDVMTGATGQNQLVVGGAGNDTYRPINNNLVTIYDNGGSADRLEAQYINLDSKDTYWGVIEGQHLYFVDYSHAQGAIVLDFKNSGVIETYVLGGKTYSHSELMARIALEGSRPQTQDRAYFRGELSWDDSAVLPAGYSRAEAVDGWAKVGVPTVAEALRPSAQPEFTQVSTATSSILRQMGSEAEMISTANAIDTGSKALATVVAELIAKAANTTVAALVVNDFVTGGTPTSAKLDSLTGFAKMQFDSTGYQATGNPRIGSYEGLGLAFSKTPEFSSKFGAGSAAQFVASTYKAAFGRDATTSQLDHFQKQYDYFSGLYTSVGIGNSEAQTGARGAVMGQMLGFATAEASNALLKAANGFLKDASDGSVAYGAPLAGFTSATVMDFV